MKISFCTTCMDRLIHLKEVYEKSIKNCQNYSNVEFILLNYNSKDDLEDWVVENLGFYIENKILKYYKTTDPIYFEASHAKNVAYKMATGDLLCNLDADNLILEGFCEYVSKIFDKNKNVILSSASQDSNGHQGCCGKIICKKEDFYSVNGYDENIYLGWGMDDTNFQLRCRLHNGLELINIDEKWNYCIKHSNFIRTKNFQLKDHTLSMSMSVAITKEAYETKQYVANQDIRWGKANLVENFYKKISI
jgi:glycosyltransferase involved in cell wall biosynthesis